MFVFYRLFHHCIHSTLSGSPSSTSLGSSTSISSDAQKDRAVIAWFTLFGFSLLFRPAVELVIRILFFLACALLLGTLDGSLNLFVGHVVLRTAKYQGYDPPLRSSLEAGSLGGIIVIGPTILTTVVLITLLGGPKLQKVLSAHVTLLFELACAIAVSTAACSLGVTIVRRTHPDDRLLLDATHAARAGTLGACIVSVPTVSTAAFFMRGAPMLPSTRNEPIAPPPRLADSLEYPISRGASTKTRQLVAHTAAETVGYVLITLCILTIRLLCF